MPRCDHCNVRIDGVYFNYGPSQLCPSCYRQATNQPTMPVRTKHCCICNVALTEDNCRTYEGVSLCQGCYLIHIRRCASCGNECYMHNIYNSPDGERVCENCYHNECYSCEDCGRAIWCDDAARVDNGIFCSECGNRNPREWDAQEFRCNDPTYEDVTTRKFGVELETSRCNNHTSLYNNTIWACKPDYSIDGMEFVSPVLYGDQGLEEIERFCDQVHPLGWSVNSRCGYHVHFDVSNETWETLRSIAYAYLLTHKMWCRFVTRERRENPMCGAPDYTLEDIAKINDGESWDYFVGARDRFEFLNWRAYFVHGTLEIRSHDATLDAEVINNWVKIHMQFIDYVRDLTIEQIEEDFGVDVNLRRQLTNLAYIIDPELVDFYYDVWTFDRVTI